MLALLPRGSALEKALLSIKAAAPPAFSSKMCTKPKITAPPSTSSTLRSVRRYPAITAIYQPVLSVIFQRRAEKAGHGSAGSPMGAFFSVYSHPFPSFPLLCLPHPHKTPQDAWTHQLATTDEGPGQPSISTVTLTKIYSHHPPFCDHQHGRGFRACTAYPCCTVMFFFFPSS